MYTHINTMFTMLCPHSMVGSGWDQKSHLMNQNSQLSNQVATFFQ